MKCSFLLTYFTMYLAIFTQIIILIFFYRYNKASDMMNKAFSLCASYDTRMMKESLEGKSSIDHSAFEWFYSKLPSVTELIFKFYPINLSKYVSEEDMMKIKSL